MPAADHQQFAAGLEHLAGDLRGAANDEGMRASHGGEQLGEVELNDHFVAGRTEPIKATFGDLFRDEDACHSFIVTGHPRQREAD